MLNDTQRSEGSPVAQMSFSQEDLQQLERVLLWYKQTHDNDEAVQHSPLWARKARHTDALLARVRWMK